MVHTLGLLIPDSMDCKTQKVIDTSVYNPSLNVSNALLEVTPPGYGCPVIIEVNKNFNTTLTAVNLHIVQGYSSGVLANMPDGIYHYKYSVDPNTKIYVEFDKFRACKIRSRLRAAIRKLFLDKSKVGKELFHEGLKKLMYVEQLINAAVYMVDDNSEYNRRALELYNEAYSLIKDFNDCETC